MADRSELKAVDEAFAYNSGVTFLTVHMVETLLDMNSELAKIDELLVDAGVEGIYHTNQEENICYSAEMLGELLAYSSNLAFYALELIDKPLYKNFNLNATESISRIKVEDYSTENTLGITYTAHTSHGDYENCAKKTLSIEDFLGVTAPENGGTLSNIPKEFTDFSNQYVTMYENLKANLVDEDGNQITLEEYLDQLVSMGEFSHTKDQPFRQFLSAVLDITIILPLIEACTGTDYITDEDLSDFERGMKGVGAVVGAFSLGTSYVAMKGAGFATQEILMNMGKAVAIDVASTTTSYWTGYACNEMGLPLPLTLMFSMGVGMGTSYGLNRLTFMSGPKVKYNSDNPYFDATYFSKLSFEERVDYIRNTPGAKLYKMVDEGSSEYSWITKNYDLITENNINDFLIVRPDGSLNLDWPKYGGLELDSIDSVGALSGKIQVSRSGSDTGFTIGYIMDEGGTLATNSQRSIPVSESVVHTGTMDLDKYKQVVDIISTGSDDIDTVLDLMDLGIDEDSALDLVRDYRSWSGRAEISGQNGIMDGLNDINRDVNSTYGYCGTAAEWTVGNVQMEGGAGQMNTVFSWGTMKESGIVSGGPDVVIH